MVTSGSVPGELLGDTKRSLGFCSDLEANRDLPEDLLSCGTLLVEVTFVEAVVSGEDETRLVSSFGTVTAARRDGDEGDPNASDGFLCTGRYLLSEIEDQLANELRDVLRMKNPTIGLVILEGDRRVAWFLGPAAVMLKAQHPRQGPVRASGCPPHWWHPTRFVESDDVFVHEQIPNCFDDYSARRPVIGILEKVVWRSEVFVADMDHTPGKFFVFLFLPREAEHVEIPLQLRKILLLLFLILRRPRSLCYHVSQGTLVHSGCQHRLIRAVDINVL